MTSTCHLICWGLGFGEGGTHTDPFPEGLWVLCDEEVDVKSESCNFPKPAQIEMDTVFFFLTFRGVFILSFFLLPYLSSLITPSPVAQAFNSCTFNVYLKYFILPTQLFPWPLKLLTHPLLMST